MNTIAPQYLMIVLAAFLSSASNAQARQDTLEQEPTRHVFHQALAWSPDCKWLSAARHEGDGEFSMDNWSIEVLAVAGDAKPRRLTDRAIVHAWSPDGKRIVFDSGRGGNWDIYSISIDGKDLQRLTTNEARDDQPDWSPDGKRIAFSSDRDGNRSIYVLAVEDKSVRKLTTDAADDYNPMWSPDGRHIVFYRERGDGKDQIHIVAADGSSERRVTDGTGHHIYPSFATNDRVVFSSVLEDGGKKVVTMTIDGTDRRVIPAVTSSFVRFSPDGKSIAYVSGRWPSTTVIVAETHGENPRTIAR